ncbi:MAG: hypothetical protein V3U57_07425 [Robiginitomaculum sp.]
MKTNYLNPFPLPQTVTSKQKNDLVKLTKKIVKATNIPNNSKEITDIFQKIDKQVYALYGLKKKHIKAIEDSL